MCKNNIFYFEELLIILKHGEKTTKFNIERIRQLLENRGIAAYRLCKDLDIDDSTYSRSIRTANTWKPHTL
jgi:hypothetical protein